MCLIIVLDLGGGDVYHRQESNTFQLDGAVGNARDLICGPRNDTVNQACDRDTFTGCVGNCVMIAMCKTSGGYHGM
jgi:hypothetical protein